ncbi:predicted protein [Naegleria gruberi]|uniref:Predicted protein n=1 Tax=Naegleria gruberi TaxID=5762 RepID=D2VV19_NAEGR|nr:uncharacterized protein NAEGRDRAFT_52488 [Naegleria gruberi]EFC39364.1 predicted protein [Naegleria gruberi]|eukprot:XP_002672108.1 predicted protein [Naegleria gruberi strain NEG-M]
MSTNQPQIVIKEVSTGKDYMTLLTMDGRLLFMGQNTFALGSVLSGEKLPDYVTCLEEACVKVVSGRGDNGVGETFLELGKKETRNFLHVGSGMYFMVVLTSDYRLISSGSNECGQTGVGQNASSMGGFSECVFNKDLQDSKNEILRGIVKIACGYQHCMILTRDGTMIGTGCSYQRQLGPIENDISYEFTKLVSPETTTPIVDIQCGYFSSSCIDANGMVYVVGQESYTRLVAAEKWTKLQTFIYDPVQYMTMSCSNSFFRTTSGLVYHNWGSNDDNENKPFENLQKLSEIPNVEYIFGKENFLAVTESKDIYLSTNSSCSGIIKPPTSDTRWFEYNGLKQHIPKNGRYQLFIADAFSFYMYFILSSNKEGHLKDNLKITLQKGQTDFEKNYFMDIIIK